MKKIEVAIVGLGLVGQRRRKFIQKNKNYNLRFVSDVRFKNKATVCKYAVPEGYPNEPIKGAEINLSKIEDQESLFYASVDVQNGILVEAGSRTIAVIGIDNTINGAEKIAEKEKWL